MKKDKKQSRQKRHIRVRKKVTGTPERPRLCVFRSTKHIYVQAINDLESKTIAASSSLVKELPKPEGDIAGKKCTAKAVGLDIAKKLQEIGISAVVFDRAGFLYHGRIAALADGAREGGLKF
ncbi:MAG: 50S ribosomal protein L18 [bacterium]|jgi:large subunit ribosomal protein L18|nr:50S ribosomal protein L18 [bacterium]